MATPSAGEFASITAESTPEDIFGPQSTKQTEVFSFDGYINDDPQVLNSVDVCYDESTPYQSLFVANYFVKNLTAFEPTKPEYYLNYVLPRVLPWAAGFLGAALVLFIFFLLWRLVRCSCRCCCSTRCGSCCKPSGTPSEVLSGCWYRFLQISISIILLGLIAVSIWGCLTAGPQLMSQFWVSVNGILEFGNFVFFLATNGVAVANTVVDDGFNLLNFLLSKIDPDSVSEILVCVNSTIGEIPDAAATVIDSLEAVNAVLVDVPTNAIATLAALSTVATAIAPAFAESTSIIAGNATFGDTLSNQTQTSLDAYGSLPSAFDAGNEAVQAVVDANTALDITGKIGLVDAFVGSLAQLEFAVQGPTLGYLSANLTQLIFNTANLVNVTVPAAVTAASAALGVASSASQCVELAFNKFKEVNASVAQLPSDVGSSLVMADEQLSSLKNTGQQLGTLQDAAQQIALPPIAGEVQGKVQQLSSNIELISVSDLQGAQEFFQGPTGLREALLAALDPVDSSTSAGEDYLASPTEQTYTAFFSTNTPAIAALTGILTALQDPTYAEELTNALGAAITANSVIQSLDLGQLDELNQSLQDGFTDDTISKLEEVNDSLDQAINLAKSVINSDLIAGVQSAQEFITSISSTLNDLNGTLISLKAEVDELMVTTAETVQDYNDAYNDLQSLIVTVRGYTDTANYTRVYVTYALFAITILAAVLVISGVWLAVPFLYIFCTGILLFMLIIFFILFIPYGTVVTVGSDSCNLMEEKIMHGLEEFGLDPEMAATAYKGLQFYFFNNGGGDVAALITEATGVSVPELEIELQGYVSMINAEVANLNLQPEPLTKYKALVAGISDIYNTVKTVISKLDYEYIHAAYVGTKSSVCCTAIGTTGTQWMAMLLAGCLIVLASLLIFAYTGRLDALPYKRGGCSCCGCWRHKASDRADQFIVGADKGNMDDYGQSAGFNAPSTPDMGRQI